MDRGINASRVLGPESDGDLQGDSPTLRTPNGETLQLLRLASDKERATGFRHDIPDTEGRTCRTEGVLRQMDAASGVFRIRGQCLATAAVARLQPPKRPVPVKALIEDGSLSMQDEPHRIAAGDDDLLRAQAIIEGKDECIAELEAMLAERRERADAEPEAADFRGVLAQPIGSEIYPGEIGDRLRAALRDILEKGTDRGWVRRSLDMFRQAVEKSDPPSGLAEFREDLRRATKDPGKLATAVPALLVRHG